MTRRVCQVRDPDDVVPGRICGRPVPCRDHVKKPIPAGPYSVRSRAFVNCGRECIFAFASSRRAERLAAPLVALMNAAHTFVEATDDRGIQTLIEAARNFTEAKP